MSVETTIASTQLDCHAMSLASFIEQSKPLVERSMHEVIYVEDEEGNVATSVRLVRNVLTDGSKTWNLVLSFVGAV